MSRVKIISDGTSVGTKVYLPNGTEIAELAYSVEIVMNSDGPPRVVLAFALGEIEIGEDNAAPGSAAPGEDPAIAAHRARVLSRG